MSLACNQLLLWHISKLREEYGICIAYCISDEILDCETPLHILYHNPKGSNHKDKSKHYIVTVICTFAFVNVTYLFMCSPVIVNALFLCINMPEAYFDHIHQAFAILFIYTPSIIYKNRTMH